MRGPPRLRRYPPRLRREGRKQARHVHLRLSCKACFRGRALCHLGALLPAVVGTSVDPAESVVPILLELSERTPNSNNRYGALHF
jgi:hypothetical protein